jgi:hypothetical protein
MISNIKSLVKPFHFINLHRNLYIRHCICSFSHIMAFNSLYYREEEDIEELVSQESTGHTEQFDIHLQSDPYEMVIQNLQRDPC